MTLDAMKSKELCFSNLLSVLKTLTVTSGSKARKKVESIYLVDCFCSELLGGSSSQILLVEIIEHIIGKHPSFCKQLHSYILKFIQFSELDSEVLLKLDRCLMKHPRYVSLYLIPVSEASGRSFLSHFGHYYLLNAQKPITNNLTNSVMEFTELSTPMYFKNLLNIPRQLIEVAYEHSHKW